MFPIKVTGEEQDSYKSCVAGRRVEHWTQSDGEVAESSCQDNFKTVREYMSEMAQVALDLPWDRRLDKVISQGPFLQPSCSMKFAICDKPFINFLFHIMLLINLYKLSFSVRDN